jgi:signal transduction histidine kinase
MWTYLFIGLSLGFAAAVPLAIFWGRRTEMRVRRLERRARTAERLAEQATLTSGLAHEIKNPLSTIGLNIQLLQEDLDKIVKDAPDGALPDEELGRIQRRFASLGRETSRLKDILEDFLRFAGRVKLDIAPVDINNLVDQLVDFFSPQATEAGINIRTQLAADPPTISVDAGLIKQAILNLLINATQAMAQAAEEQAPHGGADELMIRTQRMRTQQQDEILIHVIDTGPGMSKNVIDKVFQPYFSTRRGGSGLGLPTTRRIIEEHGGHIAVHSDLGRGSDFSIILPVKAEETN